MIQVDYFSDVLCVWAFIGEKRLTEVQKQLSTGIDVNLHFLPNFAACHQKINHGWAARGKFEGYAEHVKEVAEKFDVKLHKDTWHKVQPSTSMLAHSVIKAVLEVESKPVAAQFCSQLRSVFFIEGLDISNLEVLENIAKSLNINWPQVSAYINHGHALADLHLDFTKAQEYQVTVSPAWVFNEGRQRLIGNVGYRVIEANLKELIEQKPLPQAWC